MARPRNQNPNGMPEAYEAPGDVAPPPVLYDPGNSESIVAMVDDSLKPLIEGIPTKLLNLTEKELRRAVKPDSTLCRLRIRIWDEYFEAKAKGRKKINIANAVKGACGREFFYNVVCKDYRQLAWVFTPPVDQLLGLREMMDLGIEEMRDVLEKPTTVRIEKLDKEGNVIAIVERTDNAAVANKIKLLETLLDRVHGAVLQKQATITKKLADETKDEKLENSTLEELERLEARLDSTLQRLGAKEPAPVTVVEGEAE